MDGAQLTLNGVPVYVSGVPGHFCGAHSCTLRMNWRIGDYRVSTVAGYFILGHDTEFQMVGWDRYGETYVFRVEDVPDAPEGVIAAGYYEPLLTEHYADKDTRVAERGHYRIAASVAKCVAAGIPPGIEF